MTSEDYALGYLIEAIRAGVEYVSFDRTEDHTPDFEYKYSVPIDTDGEFLTSEFFCRASIANGELCFSFPSKEVAVQVFGGFLYNVIKTPSIVIHVEPSVGPEGDEDA